MSIRQQDVDSLAQRVVERANELGFLKDGKPLVLDQARELVASMAGFRSARALQVLPPKKRLRALVTGIAGATSMTAAGQHERQLPSRFSVCIPSNDSLRIAIVAIAPEGKSPAEALAEANTIIAQAKNAGEGQYQQYEIEDALGDAGWIVLMFDMAEEGI